MYERMTFYFFEKIVLKATSFIKQKQSVEEANFVVQNKLQL